MTVELFAVVSIGASGAPTLSRGQGIASIARQSAGQYLITLQDKYNSLLQCNVQQKAASAGTAPAAPLSLVDSETVSSTKTVVVKMRAIDNSTATDPADGQVLYINLVMSNSSVS